MDSNDQERLVAELAERLAGMREGTKNVKVGSGGRNLLIGASGYEHQIDASVETTTDLTLYECKYWARNVGPGAVLELAARGIDIQAAQPSRKVNLNLVVRTALSGGARKLAAHFQIEQLIAKSPSEFSVAYKGDRHIGLTDSGVGGDSVKVEPRESGEA